MKCSIIEHKRQSSQMDSWQTVGVFRDRCVERVDTPELVQPTELDRAQAKKERKRARDKRYRQMNADRIKANEKVWRKQNADRLLILY